MRAWQLLIGIAGTVAVLVSSARAEGEKAVQTGPPRRVIAADYSKKILAIVDQKGQIEWQEKIADIHDLWVLPDGNLLFQTSWTRMVELNPARQIVWEYNAAEMNGNHGKHVEVHAFQRLENGVTMIAESGPGRIIEVDRSGKLLKSIPLKLDKPDAHRDTRLVRKLAGGNYLVAHEGDAVVREYSGDGAVVWEYKVGSAVYSAERLGNGNTLIGCGNGSRIVEVNRQGEEVWKLEKDELPGITLAWVTMVQRLPNGDTLFVNCHAGPQNPQMVEVSPQKKVVWSFRDFQHFGNATPVARILPETEPAQK